MWIAHILHANETNGKMEQIRRKDYLEWRGVFVVVCGGLGWRRRWLDSVALLFLLPRVEVPIPASSPFLFRSVFLSWFSSLYLYPSLFFLSIPMFFIFFLLFFFSLSLSVYFFSIFLLPLPFFFLPSVFRPFPPLVLSLPLYL